MKTKILLISAGLVLLGGLFYWYEYRPASIRQKCLAKAYAEEHNGDGNARYRVCLVYNGMKAENLLK